MELFMGRVSINVDQAGRITIPSQYRSLFGAKIFAHVPKEGCISLYTEEKWNEITGYLNAGNPGPGKKAKFFSKSDNYQMDSKGRINISSELLGAAAITGPCLAAGAGDSLQLWNPKRYQALLEVPDDDYSEEGLPL